MSATASFARAVVALAVGSALLAGCAASTTGPRGLDEPSASGVGSAPPQPLAQAAPGKPGEAGRTLTTTALRYTIALTPNVQAQSTAIGDANGSTVVSIIDNGQLLWTGVLTLAAPTATPFVAGHDSPVVIEAGTRLTLAGTANSSRVILDGTIVDRGQSYPFVQRMIAVF